VQPDPKQEIFAILKKHAIIQDNETGKVIIHMSSGGITKVTKPDKDVLK
jgi:hypothetical protein